MHTLVVGSAEEALHLIDTLERPGSGFHALGYVDAESPFLASEELTAADRVARFRSVLAELHPDCVFLASLATPSPVAVAVMQAARQDTPAWMKGFLDNFYNIDKLRGTLVSDQAYQASWNLAASASAVAAVACIPTWGTDFRADLPRIDVPMLVIQGDDDQVLPYPKTGGRLPGLISNVQMAVITAGRTPSRGPTPIRSTVPC